MTNEVRKKFFIHKIILIILRICFKNWKCRSSNERDFCCNNNFHEKANWFHLWNTSQWSFYECRIYYHRYIARYYVNWYKRFWSHRLGFENNQVIYFQNGGTNIHKINVFWITNKNGCWQFMNYDEVEDSKLLTINKFWIPGMLTINCFLEEDFIRCEN